MGWVTGLWRPAEAVSLRVRLRRMLLVFGGFAALLLALGAVLIDESLETLIIQKALLAEAEHSSSGISPDRPGRHMLFERYFRGPLHSATASAAPGTGMAPPPAFAGLAPGFHEAVSVGPRDYYVYVTDRPQGRAYIAYDMSALQQRERWFMWSLLAAVAVMAALAHALGRYAANRLSKPLEELADTLQSMDPQQRQARVPEGRRDIELQQIARAFNGYLDREDELVEREKSFSQTVSHELRTPLSAIRLASATLKSRTGADAAIGEPLARIERATRQMHEIVESLLALARAGAARSFTEGPCRIEDLIEEVVESQHYLLAGREITLQIAAVEPATIHASHRLIAIMVGNLVRNAIQNTRNGTVSVRFTDGCLVVDDSGSGLGAVEPEQLFRPGVTGCSSLQTGYGLGLYIVQRISELYGWEVRLENKPSGGTRSTVVLNKRVCDNGA